MMNRSWMYNKNLPHRGGITNEFFQGVREFMNFALSNAVGGGIRCPCRKCDNQRFQDSEEVEKHLYKRGFTPDYYSWICHGEAYVEATPSFIPSTSHHIQNSNAIDPSSIQYWSGEGNPMLDPCHTHDIPSSSEPNHDFNIQPETVSSMDEHIASSESFWEVLKVADQPLWDGCEDETQLSSVMDLLRIKSECNMSETCFNQICEWAGKRLPRDHTLPSDYRQTMKLTSQLGLPVEKIDLCPKGCMLYWKEDIDLQSCKFCNKDRYVRDKWIKEVPCTQLHYLPLIPRLQRLYASPATAEHMRWHYEHESEEGIMCHPSDGEAWKDFDMKHPEFASEPRNVRLALCADGFAPFKQYGKPYSCWPVIITPYNLPPSMCMTTPYMFLTMLIPGPRNPKKLIDICLQPLIEELMVLWGQGVPTFDISRGENFIMRAALLWTINDFPAYGMLSGWSTAGMMACPVCMDRTQAFHLSHGKKPSWFDRHRKFLPCGHSYRGNKKDFLKNRTEMSCAPQRLSGQEIWNNVKDLPTAMEAPLSETTGYGTSHKWTKQSIFWRLPYWKTLLLPHNIDVMHTEKNVFDNEFHTVMNIKGRTKDTVNSRKDVKLHCTRPELEVDADHRGPIPKAVYTLNGDESKKVFEWILSLKFPDGYASNISRCVHLDDRKLVGMKSHDCHIFMQRLIPIAFREMLPAAVWGPLTELSQFFHSLCSPTLSVAHMQELENAIPLILCKLERIFPPSFFDSMEHLLIHLPYEAKVGGPVQYRWMYPFERFIRHLKDKKMNKTHVEASICNRYLAEEAARFTGHFFQSKVSSKRRRRPRQSDEGSPESNYPPLSVFNYPGEASGKSNTRWLDQKEKHVMHTHILLNCSEIAPYADIFVSQVEEANMDRSFDTNFAPWLQEYVRDPQNNVTDELIKSLAWGPNAEALRYPIYKVNGYKFHTLQRGEGKSRMNSGVWVKGSNYSSEESDFYGIIEEIIQLEYTGIPTKKIVLFKCSWFDPSKKGTRSHTKYDLVEVNHKRRYRSDDAYVLAQQAIQVFYTHYPGAKGDRVNWWAVCKTKARSTIEQRWTDDIQEAYQPEEAVRVPVVDDLLTGNLRDPNNIFIYEDDDSGDGLEMQEGDDYGDDYEMQEDDDSGDGLEMQEGDDYEMQEDDDSSF